MYLGLQALVQEKRDIRRRVLILAWPAITEMLLQMAVGIIDTAMVGRVGPVALASVGLGNQVTWAALTLFAALSVGTISLVARFTGANDQDAASNVVRQSLQAGLLFSVSIALLTHLFARNMVWALFSGAETTVKELATVYARTVASCFPAQFMLIVINGAIRGAGDTRTPMMITAMVNVINIAGNYVLIFGVGPFPRLGVQGAAIATAFALSIGGFLALYVLLAGRSVVRVSLRDPIKWDFETIKRILRIGIPAAAEQGAMRAGQIVYTMIVASLGTVAYAAHQVALNAESISYMPGFGFAIAATTLVGQCLGAGEPDDAEKSAYVANLMGMLVMGIMGSIFFLLAEPLVSIFSRDPEVVKQGAAVLRIVAISQPALAVVMILAGGLRGAGDTRAVMLITFAGFFGVRLAISYILAVRLGFGLIGAWIGMSVDLIFRAILTFLHFRKGQWKTLRV